MYKYRIIKTLGDGSFGTVFKAMNVQDNEVVAIKKMKQKYEDWDECIKLREVKSLRKLSHPNIVRLQYVLRQNNDLYLVFDFLEYNLYQVYNNAKEKGRSFTEAEIRNIVYQIVQGLNHVHKNGFFHRDLKPYNILFDNNTVKLCDFGLAREIRSRPPFTDYVSTRWYRAPYLLLRSPVYNSPVDIFALGLIMAEMYLLNPLLPGANEIDQMNKMVGLLGTPTKSYWPEGHRLATALNYKFPEAKKTELFDLIPSASTDAIDLMESMLQWSARNRPSAAEILKHPFFYKINLNYYTDFNKENKGQTKFEECAYNNSIVVMPQSLKVENPKYMYLRKTKLKFGQEGQVQGQRKTFFYNNISQKFDELYYLIAYLSKKEKDRESVSDVIERASTNTKEIEPKSYNYSKFPQIGRTKKEYEDPYRLPSFNPMKSIQKIPMPTKLPYYRASGSRY